jgi:eukaryotic-like serine/threonine-protein kinase
MKRSFFVMLVIAFFASACQLGGGGAQPTAVALPGDAKPAGGSPKAGSEQVSSADGMLQVYIPAGSFQMGGLDTRAATDEKPVHKVDMKGYWIDKVEVTNAMYLLCVQAGVCNPPQNVTSESRPSYFNNPEFNDYPVVNVTWESAKKYCDWAGRRLPTEAEWEYAARGSTINTYPWGEQKPDGTYANFNYMQGDTSRVGNFAAGASPFGILDMAGNVLEWTNDFYNAEYYASGSANNPAGPNVRANYFRRVARGGSYADPEVSIRLSKRASVLGPNLEAELGSAAYLGEFSPRIGFRCAED